MQSRTSGHPGSMSGSPTIISKKANVSLTWSEWNSALSNLICDSWSKASDWMEECVKIMR